MSNNTVSGWEKASTVATCSQVIIVAFSLLFIWYQLRQQKLQLAQQTLQLNQQVELSRAANTQALVGLIIPLNLKVTDPGMAELWLKGEEGINKVFDRRERELKMQQYDHLLASYMVFYENAYSQCVAGLLDEEIYNGWDKDLAGFIEEHKIAKNWDQWKHLYREGFSNRVSQIIASPESTLPKQRCQK